jgi:hypothetical protein
VGAVAADAVRLIGTLHRGVCPREARRCSASVAA